MSLTAESETGVEIGEQYDLLVAQPLDAVPENSRRARAWVTQVSRQIAIGSPQRLNAVSPEVVDDEVIEQITRANTSEVAGTVARVLLTRKDENELIAAELSTNAIRYANTQAVHSEGELQLAQVQAVTGSISDGGKISDAQLGDLEAMLANSSLDAVLAPEKPAQFVVALGVKTASQAVDIFVGDINRSLGKSSLAEVPADAESGRGGLIVDRLSDHAAFEFGSNVKIIGDLAGVELAKVKRARVSAPRLPVPQQRSRAPRR
jgi:hypothetical protein